MQVSTLKAERSNGSRQEAHILEKTREMETMTVDRDKARKECEHLKVQVG